MSPNSLVFSFLSKFTNRSTCWCKRWYIAALQVSTTERKVRSNQWPIQSTPVYNSLLACCELPCRRRKLLHQTLSNVWNDYYDWSSSGNREAARFRETPTKSYPKLNWIDIFSIGRSTQVRWADGYRDRVLPKSRLTARAGTSTDAQLRKTYFLKTKFEMFISRKRWEHQCKNMKLI